MITTRPIVFSDQRILFLVANFLSSSPLLTTRKLREWRFISPTFSSSFQALSLKDTQPNTLPCNQTKTFILCVRVAVYVVQWKRKLFCFLLRYNSAINMFFRLLNGAQWWKARTDSDFMSGWKPPRCDGKEKTSNFSRDFPPSDSLCNRFFYNSMRNKLCSPGNCSTRIITELNRTFHTFFILLLALPA